MHKNTKVATCCYCGTRAALVLDRGRHELTCAGCGAPLHDLKMMPVRQGPPPEPQRRTLPQESRGYPGKPSKKRKKRKSRTKKIFEEALDLLEDIFD